MAPPGSGPLLPGQLDPAVLLPADHPGLLLRRVLTDEGKADPGRIESLGLQPDELRRLYGGMLLIRLMDERLLAMQRQGRIGFYGEARGQEAAIIGTAAALAQQDYIVPALREAGAALFRGLPLSLYIAQLFGNDHDVTKGRQLPCHPGTREARYVTMSSCIATQLPHAVGMAMAAKHKGDDVVIAGYMGDGATSEADFHVALNFAGVFKAPVVFVCQNNQWAISTPCNAQTASATIAQKGIAYGVPFLRADGNDVLACYEVMREAVTRARAGMGPTLVEALTYRVSAHSSSDDPSRYRDESVTEAWRARDPLLRFRRFLQYYCAFSDEEDAAMRADIEAKVKDTVASEEKVPPPPLSSLVTDVFAEVPQNLAEQLRELELLPRQLDKAAHG